MFNLPENYPIFLPKNVSPEELIALIQEVTQNGEKAKESK